ncbi:MAG: diguanylate cyclase domain-containing protein [Pseudomonadota bacterium]
MSTNNRLADFIRAEMEWILQDWEEFAKTLFHARQLSQTELRDHAREMLLEIADATDPPPNRSEQPPNSNLPEPEGDEESWAELHGVDRQTQGFSVMETISEFRALRARVVAHWTASCPSISCKALTDLARFHEAIDEAVAESLEHYTTEKEMETRLFGAVRLASPDPIYVLDLDGRFIYANRATEALFAQKRESIIGKSTLEMGFSFASDFQRSLEKAIANQSTYRGEFRQAFASGQGERFEYLLAPVLDDHQQTEAIVCIFRDVTERALAEEKIWHDAHHDLLTGLPNRRLFLDRLEQEVKHAKRSSLPLALLFLDLDGFKAVNDSLGHEAGDSVLCDVAERLDGGLREDDTVARLGGDEFTVILTGVKQRKDVEGVAQTIIDALARPFQTGDHTVQITVSIGISLYPQHASSPVALLEAADQAMYTAKESGANQMRFYESPDRTNKHLA